jgi:multidrug efflux pump subunit AcrB
MDVIASANRRNVPQKVRCCAIFTRSRSFVVALTIPLVLDATFFAMSLLEIDLHRISLGALVIALGLLVDNAMIAVEMMDRKLREGLDRLAAATFAYIHSISDANWHAGHRRWLHSRRVRAK